MVKRSSPVVSRKVVRKPVLRAGEWIPEGGKTRGFVNVSTGARISRRQFDKNYGKLKKQGFVSYERKAAASKKYTPLDYAVRPRRGHKSGRVHFALTKPRTPKSKAKAKLQPLVNFAKIRPPRKGFHKFYGLPYTIEALAWFVQTVWKNKNVLCAGVPNLIVIDEKGLLYFSHKIIPCTVKEEFPTVSELWELIQSNVDSAGKVSGAVVIGINVNVTFTDKAVEKAQGLHPAKG